MKIHAKCASWLAALLGILAVLPVGCTSRYTMNLWLVRDREQAGRAKIDVEETSYAPDTKLSDPNGTPWVVAGDRSTVVISLGMRGEPIEQGAANIALGFDQYLKYRIYLQLPPAPIAATDTVPLAGNSVVRLMKFYEIPQIDKTYLPVGSAGSFIIDSVKSGSLFGTFEDAFWENIKGDRIGFEGRIKFKIR